MTTSQRTLTTIMFAVAVTPALRWLILTHSVAPGQPWRIQCRCGNPLWPDACGPSGRCRTCGTQPGPPGYLIEAITIIVAATTVLAAPGIWQAAAAIWWTAGAVVLAAVDASVRRLPHRVTAATTTGYIGLLVCAADAAVLARAVMGAALAIAVFTMAALLRRGHVGWGDVGLAAPVAAFLTSNSWTALLHGYLAGFAAAVAYLVTARIAGRPRSTVPLGPFLIAGALTTVHL